MPRRPGLGHNGLAPSADERLHVRVNSNLITLRSILDLDIARRFEWDAALVVELSGVDRPGDLSPRVAEDPGGLYDIASQGITPGSAIERALSHELHDAIQRRCRLWMAGIPTGHLDRLRSELGEGIVHVAGAPDEGLTPVALAPLELLKAWSQGSDRQRAFVRKSMAGLDTLTTSSTATWAARQVGAPIIERSVFLRLCRNPKFIAYVVVFAYSLIRAVPVMYVPHFKGNWRVLWAIDIVTAIPTTWGIIEMVAGQKLWHRVIGAITTAVTFFAPYVYFLMYGRHAPLSVWLVVAAIFFSAIFLEVYRAMRDSAVRRGLARRCLEPDDELAPTGP